MNDNVIELETKEAPANEGPQLTAEEWEKLSDDVLDAEHAYYAAFKTNEDFLETCTVEEASGQRSRDSNTRKSSAGTTWSSS